MQMENFEQEVIDFLEDKLEKLNTLKQGVEDAISVFKRDNPQIRGLVKVSNRNKGLTDFVKSVVIEANTPLTARQIAERAYETFRITGGKQQYQFQATISGILKTLINTQKFERVKNDQGIYTYTVRPII